MSRTHDREGLKTYSGCLKLGSETSEAGGAATGIHLVVFFDRDRTGQRIELPRVVGGL